MLSPPRLPASWVGFNAGASTPRSRASTGVMRCEKYGVLHAKPCTVMHGLFEFNGGIFRSILCGWLLAQFSLPVRVNMVLCQCIFLLIINPRSLIRPESDGCQNVAVSRCVMNFRAGRQPI